MALIKNLDGTLTHSHESGSQTYRRTADGTCYRDKTPQAVVDILERSRKTGSRLRLFLGDPETGRDWMEENDIEGRVGRSTGELKVPLLLARASSTGGGAISDRCIVRIMEGGREVWRHSSYHTGKIEMRESGNPKAPAGVFRDGELIAGFNTVSMAAKWAEFMVGNGPRPRERVPAPARNAAMSM